MLDIEIYQGVVEDITNNGLKSKSKAELLEIRQVLIRQRPISSSAPFISMVQNEIEKRESALAYKVLFWAAIIAAIASVIAAVPTVQQWFQASPSLGKAASSQMPTTNSAPPSVPLK